MGSDFEKNRFKCLLVGDSFVGKSSFIKRFKEEKHYDTYTPTKDFVIHTLKFDVTSKHVYRQKIIFDVWDISGNNKFFKKSPSYINDIKDAQCAIIMFDVCSRKTLNSVVKWKKAIIDICGYIPMVVCGNKIDIISRKNKTGVNKVSSIKAGHLKHFMISNKYSTDLKKPCLHLVKLLNKDEELKLPYEEPFNRTGGCGGEFLKGKEGELEREMMEFERSCLRPEDDEDL